MALRCDARRDPRPTAWEVSARAARGLRSQSKIAAQESPKGVGDQCFARPPDEHAIWRSEMSLKGASGGRGHAVPCPRHMRWRQYSSFLK